MPRLRKTATFGSSNWRPEDQLGDIIHYYDANYDSRCRAAIITDVYPGSVRDLMVFQGGGYIFRARVEQEDDADLNNGMPHNKTWHLKYECRNE